MSRHQEPLADWERDLLYGEVMSARQGTRTAEVIKVIRTTSLVGKGTSEDVARERIDYWTLDGRLLAVVDPEADL